MKKEYETLIQNHTWSIIPPLSYGKVIGNKWIFKVKFKLDKTLKKYKARVVTKWYNQIEWIDYQEIFNPLVKLTII